MEAQNNVLLEVKDLSVNFTTLLQKVEAVNGVSFSVEKGKALGIVGETGAGKTTTALAIMNLLDQRMANVSGEIHFSGEDLLKKSEKELCNIRGKGISMIFQDPMTSLNPILTIGEQIREVLKLHAEPGTSKQQIEDRVDEVLELVSIPKSRKKDYPHQFSGGMQQRVVIAMALACEPLLLIADEPTTALDVTIQAQVLAMMSELQEKLNTAMIMITHDLGIVAQTCDDVAVMYAGEIIEMGTADQVFNDKEHHPYTTGLFNSIPRLDDESRRLQPIDGLMPDPTQLPKGCSFAPRCPHCTEACEREKPAVFNKDNHMIRCILFGGEQEVRNGE